MDRIYLNGMIGFAVGDALGAPAEFGERWMRDMDPVKKMRSGGVFDVPEGGWTDDTSMTIATMESLKNGFDPEDMMKRFLSWYRTGEYSWCGKPIGIGKQVLKALEHYEQFGDIGTCGGRTEMDNGNGSLMRMLPVCLYGYEMQKRGKYGTDDVVRMIHQASELTHAHMRSKIACGLYYFLVEAILDNRGNLYECIRYGLKQGMEYYGSELELRFYERLKDLEWFCRLDRDEIRSSGYVVDTLEAVIWCLVTTNTFKESLLKAVNLGLDTDTIAALTGGLAGLHYGYEEIPGEWIEVLKMRDELLLTYKKEYIVFETKLIEYYDFLYGDSELSSAFYWFYNDYYQNDVIQEFLQNIELDYTELSEEERKEYEESLAQIKTFKQKVGYPSTIYDIEKSQTIHYVFNFMFMPIEDQKRLLFTDSKYEELGGLSKKTFLLLRKLKKGEITENEILEEKERILKEAEKLCSEVMPYNKEAASITFDIIKAYFKKMGYGENLWGFNR